MALPLITSEQRYLISRGGNATDRLPVLAADFNPLVTVVNDLIDGTTSLTEVEVGNGSETAPSITFTSDPDTGLYRAGANTLGITAAGAAVGSWSATSLAITGGVSTTTTGSIGTSLNIGTDVTLAKEVNHAVTVTTTTTAATAGGNLSVTSGAGATTGSGGSISVTGGASGSGATGNGGAATITAGAALSTNGNGGAASLVGGAGTGTGSGGNVLLTPGASTSTTVAPAVIASAGLVKKPTSASVASGATITGKELVGGLIAATGATGNWQLPAATAITTAIGATPAGTNFEFVFNAQAMTATNTATLVVGAGMTVASAPAITGGGTLTVTQDTQVTGGFRIVFDTATTCKIYRIW